MRPNDIVEAARKYLGVKWQHQGRSEFGVDCLGLIVNVARDCGMEVFDSTDYSRVPDGNRLVKELDEQMIRVDVADIGDVLLMRFGAGPQHLAIVTDVGIIHAWHGPKKVVEHVFDDEWRKRTVRAYRFPLVTK